MSEDVATAVMTALRLLGNTWTLLTIRVSRHVRGVKLGERRGFESQTRGLTVTVIDEARLIIIVRGGPAPGRFPSPRIAGNADTGDILGKTRLLN